MTEQTIKNGEAFKFSNYQEAYNFLITNRHKCEPDVTLGIPGSETNTVIATYGRCAKRDQTPKKEEK